MPFFARDPALRPACALPDSGTVRGLRKCLFCLVKSLNWLPISLPSSCIQVLGRMTDLDPSSRIIVFFVGSCHSKKSCHGLGFCECLCVFGWLRMACRHPDSAVVGGTEVARSVPSPESAGSSGNGVCDSGAIRR